MLLIDRHVAVYKNFRSLNVEWDAGAAPVIAVLLHLLSDVDPAISARAGFTIGKNQSSAFRF